MTDQELKDLVASFAEDRKEIWQILKETDLQQKETARQKEETDRVMEELGRKIDKVCGIDPRQTWAEASRVVEELGRKVDKVCGIDPRQTWAEASRVVEELGRKVDKVCGKVGGIDENLGHHAEQFFQDVFKKKREFGGIKYDSVDSNVNRDGRNGKMEVDILLENGTSVALIEVKNRIHPDFVTEFAQERVKKFRALYPKYDNCKLYLGIAGFSFDDKVLEKAKENGVGIVKQVGEGVEIEAEHLKAY